MENYSRLELMFGKENLEKIKNSSVIVFGLGGVGSYVVEALARYGVGKIGLCDSDVIELSNINRQLFALNSTLGMKKTEVAKERVKDIYPNCNVETFDIFYLSDTQDEINLKEYDYIIDAIDTVTAKILLVENADKLDIPIISAMGTGNKNNPTQFVIDDIYNTRVCPLARVMRRELKKRGIEKLNVVYSDEMPKIKKSIISSNATVPASCGLIMANYVVNQIIDN